MELLRNMSDRELATKSKHVSIDVIGGALVLLLPVLLSTFVGCRSTYQVGFCSRCDKRFYADSLHERATALELFEHAEISHKAEVESLRDVIAELRNRVYVGSAYGSYNKTWEESLREERKHWWGEVDSHDEWLAQEQNELFLTMESDPCSWNFSIEDGEEFLIYSGEQEDIKIAKGEENSYFVVHPFQKRITNAAVAKRYVDKLKMAKMIANIKHCIRNEAEEVDDETSE